MQINWTTKLRIKEKGKRKQRARKSSILTYAHARKFKKLFNYNDSHPQSHSALIVTRPRDQEKTGPEDKNELHPISPKNCPFCR